ncbi:MAG: carotenoid biosynthesis protein, partial [Omnitrophica WOR_2 bacterium]
MKIRRFSYYLLWIYALLTAFTILLALLNIHIPTFVTPILTLLAFLYALLHGSQRFGWKRALLLLGLTFGISLFFESVGVATGLIYGKYHYTDLLGVKFLGLVPWLIPVAWFMMSYPSYIIASRLVPAVWKIWQQRLSVAALGAVIMTAWDLALDPMMVGGGYWVWEVPGVYFGIPLQNYWGWWLTIFIIFFMFTWISNTYPLSQKPAGDDYDHGAIASYAISGLGSICFVWISGSGGPALAGLFAMLPWVVMG